MRSVSSTRIRLLATLSVLCSSAVVTLVSGEDDPERDVLGRQSGIGRRHPHGDSYERLKLVPNAAEKDEKALKKVERLYKFLGVSLVTDSNDMKLHAPSKATTIKTRNSAKGKKKKKKKKGHKKKPPKHVDSTNSNSRAKCDSFSDTRSKGLSYSGDQERCDDDEWEPTGAPVRSPSNEVGGNSRDSGDNNDDDGAFPPTKGPTTTKAPSSNDVGTDGPAPVPTARPTNEPTATPSAPPTETSSSAPTTAPSASPSISPSVSPSVSPTGTPSVAPTLSSESPSRTPTQPPTTYSPTPLPTTSPTPLPTTSPTQSDPIRVQRIWINEFHYQNQGVDDTEFVEVAHTEGMDLTGYKLLFYDGSTGFSYKEEDVVGNTGDSLQTVNSSTSNGITFVAIRVYEVDSQILAGPAGIAVVDTVGGTVPEFISYGRPFTALNGPAQGLTCVNTQVEEPEDASSLVSLQLGGTGNQAGDFVWQAVQVNTAGSVNAGQTIVPQGGAVATPSPTTSPTKAPTTAPTKAPTTAPIAVTTPQPSPSPTVVSITSLAPTASPTKSPTASPTKVPTKIPTTSPTKAPTKDPTAAPTNSPTTSSPTTPSPTKSSRPTTAIPPDPTPAPTKAPTTSPSKLPTGAPTKAPTPSPTKNPTPSPTKNPTSSPTKNPTPSPTKNPTPSPTKNSTPSPTKNPTASPTKQATFSPTQSPTPSPTKKQTPSPTKSPTPSPTKFPTPSPTKSPTKSPTTPPTPAAVVTDQPTAPTFTCPETIWINEFHYQNRFVDASEFVEIAYTESLSLAGYRILFYDGGSGDVYKEFVPETAPVSRSETVNGITVSAFQVYTLRNEMRNGPDAIAVVDGANAVRDFVAYGGGSVTATAGPAAGLTASSVGSESANEGSLNSLQLGGSGSTKDDFTWQGVLTATPGRVNTGQSMVVCTAVTQTSQQQQQQVLQLQEQRQDFLTLFTTMFKNLFDTTVDFSGPF